MPKLVPDFGTDEDVTMRHDLTDKQFYRWLLGRGVKDIARYTDEEIMDAVSLIILDEEFAAEEGSKVRALLEELGVFDAPMKRAPNVPKKRYGNRMVN